MPNNFRITFLICAFSLLTLHTGLADYWDYYGSGRDHAYSQYVDMHYYSGHVQLSPYSADISDAPFLAPYPPSPVIAPVPTVIANPQTDEFTINIPNRNGGYIAVVIKKSGDGYLGPKGEYYPEFPKIFQLEMIYGN